MEWLFDKLPVLVFVVVVIVQILRAVRKSASARKEHEREHTDYDEQRRVREIQEQIRRRIAERRQGGETADEPPVMRPSEPAPVPRPETTQMPDPFGGPLRRVLDELERRVQPPAPPPPVLPVETRAEVVRQEDLAEQLRLLEETRALAQRRAAHLAEAREAEAHSESGLRSVARQRLLEDLHDPQSLRRAMLLREVLGTPVGLR